MTSLGLSVSCERSGPALWPGHFPEEFLPPALGCPPASLGGLPLFHSLAQRSLFPRLLAGHIPLPLLSEAERLALSILGTDSHTSVARSPGFCEPSLSHRTAFPHRKYVASLGVSRSFRPLDGSEVPSRVRRGLRNSPVSVSPWARSLLWALLLAGSAPDTRNVRKRKVVPGGSGDDEKGKHKQTRGSHSVGCLPLGGQPRVVPASLG